MCAKQCAARDNTLCWVYVIDTIWQTKTTLKYLPHSGSTHFIFAHTIWREHRAAYIMKTCVLMRRGRALLDATKVRCTQSHLLKLGCIIFNARARVIESERRDERN